MHVLEAALFASLFSKGQGKHLPEQWQTVPERPEAHKRPFRAAAIAAATAIMAVGAIVITLTMVATGTTDRPAGQAGLVTHSNS